MIDDTKLNILDTDLYKIVVLLPHLGLAKPINPVGTCVPKLA